jgi:hypothetical protein
VSISIGVGGGSAVADLLLEHHRAYYRPRVEVPPPPPTSAPAPRAPSARPITAALTPGAAVTQVLVIRFIACLVLWATAGTVYGFWQLGNALVPASPHGVVTCGTQRAIGSLPGC